MEAASLSAAATTSAAQIARQAMLERDEREDRRRRVDALLAKAAACEEIVRSTATMTKMGGVAEAQKGLDRLNQSTQIDAADHYLGLEDETFHDSVVNYLRADRATVAALWSLCATETLRAHATSGTWPALGEQAHHRARIAGQVVSLGVPDAGGGQDGAVVVGDYGHGRRLQPAVLAPGHQHVSGGLGREGGDNRSLLDKPGMPSD